MKPNIKIRIFILLFINFEVIFANYQGNLPDHYPKFLKTGPYAQSFQSKTYGSGGTKTFTKTHTKSSRSGSYGSKTIGSYAQQYTAGCQGTPRPPMNSHIRCALDNCNATCLSGFRFPDGQTRLLLACKNNVWSVVRPDWLGVSVGEHYDVIPSSCQPICEPECQNNGICYEPNKCNCPENFSGNRCQDHRKPCLNYPTLPMNARRTCSSTHCTVTCLKGHNFPDGSAIANLKCSEGSWLPSRDDWAHLPDCLPNCSPPCLNGGNCLSLNTCQCPQDFRGSHCQYRADTCSVTKLGFNGGYNCSGDQDAFSCTLNCPIGIHFEFSPSQFYTCRFDTGIFQPQPIPQCVFNSNVEIFQLGNSNDTFYSHEYEHIKKSNLYSSLNHQIGIKTLRNNSTLKTIENNLPKPGLCSYWSAQHFKTFDGSMFSAISDCTHVLLRDKDDHSFSIVVGPNNACKQTTASQCSRAIYLYVGDKEYILKNSEMGNPTLYGPGGKKLPLPGAVSGLRSMLQAHHVILLLDNLGIAIKWDTKNLIQISVTESFWNRTEGLCGTLDGHKANDLQTKDGHNAKTIASFLDSWKLNLLDDVCLSPVRDTFSCSLVSKTLASRAHQYCTQILSDKRFSKCSEVLDISQFLEACQSDFCNCGDPGSNPGLCSCQTIEVFAEECKKQMKTELQWRDDDNCPMQCTGGRVYVACSTTSSQPTCGSEVFEETPSQATHPNAQCIEGCFCPKGLVLHAGQCINPTMCPCSLRGREFKPGTQIPKECNTCTCESGKWVCTQVECGSRCSAVGDPHYETFDGKRYDFMGQCRYYLVKSSNFSIEAENIACAGSISQTMNFPVNIASGLPSCTRSVTIKTNNHLIKLKQNQEVVIDGHDVTKLPYYIGEDGDVVRVASSLFIVVELSNGVQVWWDGITRVYIDAPPTLRGHTRGLCGTFNTNQKDDFLTPEGDIENDPIIFANKWKIDESCEDVKPKVNLEHPCEINIHNKQKAEKYCAILQSKTFSKCHWFLDPKPFYDNCLYDMCSCETKTSDCLCATLGAYGTSCASLGAGVPWRIDVPECAIQCPVGETYQFCGNSCSRTCKDISTRTQCKNVCVEGCNCKEMEALDEDYQCVPIASCPCYENGIKFPPNYKEIRQNIVQELCTCLNGIWNCRVATQEEIKEHPLQNNRQSICPVDKNQEFTTCEPEPITCKNMHQHYSLFGTSETEMLGSSVAVCRPGCKCKAGYVLQDSFAGSGRCIKPEECPCHHGGQSYKETQTIMNDCNKCTCNSGLWTCEKKLCSGTCSTWGDSHFTTFDDKDFDYQGQCDYVFTKGSLGQHDQFEIIVQNVPCGTLGVSCTKAISISISGETFILEKDKKIPDLKLLKRMTLRQTDLYVIIESQSLGLSIIWDKGTRLSVKVDPRWQNRLKGLCGNYNQDPTDDFQTPSGGFIEINATIFGDSWQVDSFCQKGVEITDTCALRPERKAWALKKCGLLKSNLFRACHTAVQVDRFLERCIFDTCACDQGDDCECLCTALAAYAQECNEKGVPIKWRSQKLCPMQCDESCSNYSPCMSTCPLETCDNIITHPKVGFGCKEDTCIEGCAPKICPEGQIYLNGSAKECVPRNTCKPICMEMDDKIYSEGDLIEEDECHKCFCSNFKKICTGKPCHKNVTIVPNEQQLKCVSGWSNWINTDTNTKHKKGKKVDIEPIPSPILLNSFSDGGRCALDKMTDIQCRTTKGHIDYKATNLDVECSLEHGLICKKTKSHFCPDFEIRVLCQCEQMQQLPQPEVMSCDDNTYRKHDYDCHLFYQCSNGQLVEKTCGPNMYFNPETQICDWPNIVLTIRPNCSHLESNLHNKPIFVVPKVEQTAVEQLNDSICPPNYIYSECGTECNRLCLYYDHIVKSKGHCLTGSSCEAGCVSASRKLACPLGHLWRDNTTCVETKDCLCVSNNGQPVAPATINKENDCLICQCIDNNYICENICKTTSLPQTTPSPDFTGVDALPDFETQPEACPPEHLHSVFLNNPQIVETNFVASSKINEYHQPWFAEMNAQLPALSAGSWQPEADTPEEYIQVDLIHPEPIYQIVLMGHPIYDFYVTSFYVLYTLEQNPVNFRYAKTRSGSPQLFRGNLDHITPIKNTFEVPFEARFVKIVPKSWHNHIAVRFDLIGCSEDKITTTPPYQTTPLPVEITTTNLGTQCDEPMGLEQQLLPQELIKVSSEKIPDLDYFGLQLNGPNSWQPLTNTPNEYVLFNFTSPKQLTGVRTQGGPLGWVQSYKIKYSRDNHIFTPILDDFGSEKLFPANFDQNTVYTNMFSRPIRAQYLKIIPKKWTNNIQMRVEPIGCFESYPTRPPLPTVQPEAEEPNLGCNHCPGTQPPISETLNGVCVCEGQKYFDGSSCINRYECPCKVNDLTYKVGTIFETSDCQECLCVIGGTSQCSPKKCPNCEKGLRPVSGPNCDCFCEPCPIGQILCPTSNICIKLDQWCDGIVDCSDDETNCESSTIEPIITTKKYEHQQCPAVVCPKGFKIVLKKTEPNVSPMFQMYGGRKQKLSTNQITAKYFGTKGRTIAQRVNTKTLPRKPVKSSQKNKQNCVEFICEPQTVGSCPEPKCPAGYSIVYDKHETMEICQTYECKPPDVQDDICNVTGRNFKTFDNFEYKYDVCNHILARDLAMEEWDILLTKQCEEVCTKILTIRHGNQMIKIFPDLSIEFNGYKYTAEQTGKIGAKNLAFTVSKMGHSLLFVSNHYGFWVMFNTQANIKVGISQKLAGQVDGLCGFYDHQANNDKRTPAGKQAKTSAQFGDSWLLPSQDQQCDTKACSLQIQNQAFQMCERVKNQILAPCHHAIHDMDAWISRCLETTCQCLEQTNSTQNLETTCGCNVLESFVVDCVTARPNVVLEDWRMSLECPSNCPPNLVPNDCYRRRCELSCANLAEVDSCPVLPNLCFPGCYCPPGLVRKGADKCVPPKECRDCECNVLPHLEYITYDGKNYNANTNCTYIMAREKAAQNDETEREFEVYVTNDNCPNNPHKLCTSAINFKVNHHRIEVTRNNNPSEDFVVHIDDYQIDKLPFDNGWVEITKMVQGHINIIVPKLQIELRTYYPTLGASLRVPSLSYQGRLEGLCGDCDRNPDNDVLGPNQEPILDPKQFLDAWKAPRPGQNHSDAVCTEEETKECPELKGPDGKDPCLTLLDPDKFGKCHMLLDPAIFLSTCYHETCNNKPESACSSIQTYALGCRALGVCLDYHTELCPPRSCPPEADYQLCGPPCPKTCENPDGCTKGVPKEGCFCPEGLVLKNNSQCVPERLCYPCDDLGHFPGDTWQPDACTKCTCDVTSRSVKCETTACPAMDTVCEPGFDSVKIKTAQECCEKFICVKTNTTKKNCTDPQPLNCGPNQQRKLEPRPDGCLAFVCQCIPKSECPKLNLNQPLTDLGYEWVRNDSGCCPRLDKVCKVNKCPPELKCSKFYTLEVQETDCCPEYKCRAPKDSCIFTPSYTTSELGGERPLSKLESAPLLLKEDEVYNDGPCRHCKCFKDQNTNTYTTSCTISECSKPSELTDNNDFVLEEIWSKGQCCPKFRKTACRFQSGIRAPGEKWPQDPINSPCTILECLKGLADLDDVSIVKHEVTCDKNCPTGSTYYPATGSGECCGSCKQTSCVVDGIEKTIDSQWLSEDFCTEYKCVQDNGTIFVQKKDVICDKPNEELQQQYIYSYTPQPNNCCGTFTPISCLVDGVSQHVGSTWPDPLGDPCVTVTCLHTETGNLVQQRVQEKCNTECRQGWKYRESGSSDICCGNCVQVSCISNNTEYLPGDTWSSDDGCTSFECTKSSDGTLSVRTYSQSCPDVSSCPESRIFNDGCCLKCNLTIEDLKASCEPVPISIEQTIGLVTQTNKEHGQCKNLDSINNFTECRGQCSSGTYFNQRTVSHENNCKCCTATKYVGIPVEMICLDGYTFKKTIAVPTECSCQDCGENTSKNVKG